MSGIIENNILSKEGYLIYKKNIDIKVIEKIKKDLTVTPFLAFKINKNVIAEPFPVFQENDEYLCIPKYYGIEKFGIPPINKEIIGSPIDINFTSSLREKQVEIINSILPKLENNDGGLLSLSCGSGKCMAKDTKILLFNGNIIKIQDIKIGDQLMGDDSKPRNVLSLARGRETMYKINNDDDIGDGYIVNESHILSLQYGIGFFGKIPGTIIDISLLTYLDLYKNDFKTFKSLHGYRVPINFSEKKIEINPYFFGYWLDDEYSNIATISLKNKNIIDFIINCLKIDNDSLFINLTSSYNYSISSKNKINIFKEFIKKYSLNNKHIPLHYKCNSRKIQLALLAGIIDSNTSIHYIVNDINFYDYYEIIKKDNKLLDDIIYLARSLGFYISKTIIKKKTEKIIIDDNYYSIKIYGPCIEDLPILCKKKIYSDKKSLRYRISVKKLLIDDYYGFEIDGNKRFVLDDFTVTHNTVLSLYIACHFKVKTLVIVHKSFLLNQWIERAKQFTDAKIGIIQQNKIDIDGKDIVIGMLQSIAKGKYDSDVFRDFGLVIFDEAHHAPSRYFSKALPIIACKKTLSLSATWKRSDKLEKILLWYFGPIIYEEKTEKINNVQVNIYKYNSIHKNFKEYKLYTGDINRAGTINKLVEIEIRNKFILKQIKKILLEYGRRILILSDRVKHLELLKNSIDYLEITTTGFYIGGLKQKILDESSKAHVIFATYSMASEALDIPDLNTLIMVTPRKNIVQSVGRILRRPDQQIVQPLIIDIVDQLTSFNNQGLVRRKFYLKCGYNIKIFEVEEDKIINQTNYEKIAEIIPINSNCLFLDDDEDD